MLKEKVGGRLGWAALGVAALLAGGGAARLPDGLRFGAPNVVFAMAVLAAAAIAAWRWPERGHLLVALLVVPALALVVPGSAGSGALLGPPLAALIAAGLLLIVPETAVPPRALFVPVVLLLYLCVSARVQHQVGPQGDEPHYLMVADSLLRDHDLSLESDYREGRYSAFFRGPLEPHYRVRGRHGEIYSLHALGLSLLVLPAYAVFGYAGASLFMAGLAVLAALAIRALLIAATDATTGERVGWLVALSPPLVHYAGLIFTEVPAALIAAWTLREGLRAREVSPWRAAAAGAALAFLPWLNVRYAILAAIVCAFWLAARPPRRVIAALVAPGLASAAALAAYHHALYGFFDPRRVYGTRREFALPTLKEGLPGLLMDQEFGLLIYAPIFVLALPGLVALARRRPRLGATALVLVAAVAITAGSWHMWRGGFNPPARFLVPVVPVLALGVSIWMQGRRWVGAALLAGWGVFTGLAGAGDPVLVHRDRDGTAPLFRARSGATEWTRLLPSYVLEERDRHRLALLWAMLLAAAAVRGRAPRARSFGAALLLIAAAAEAASRLSDARAGGREAIHGLGHAALDWPHLHVATGTTTRWTTRDLTWGPLYQPHRDSGRVAAAERLALNAGSYRLELDLEPLGGGGLEPPAALRALGSQGRPIGRFPCSSSGSVWVCAFDVPSSSDEISLYLEGGTPCQINEIRLQLAPSTFQGTTGLIRQEGKVGGSEK
jgi:hypothetical protein